MKRFLSLSAVLVLVALAACTSGPGSNKGPHQGANPLILRAHFIGSENLFATPESASLKKLWNLKSSLALREEALNRFAQLPALWVRAGAGTPTLTNLFRPLLDDLLTREFYLEARATPEFLLAARLPEGRARLWETNLIQAATVWKLGRPTPVSVEGVAGWAVQKTGLPGSIRFVRAGEWVLLSVGVTPSAQESQMLAAIKSSGRPGKLTGAWLEGDANLARFESWLPVLADFDNLPVAHFSLSNRTDFVRTLATLDFPKPHGWKPEPWLIPTNQIREPLVSFVAMRGVAPWLQSIPSIRDLGYKPTPNQIIGWGHRAIPFQFTYVAPSRDVRAQLKKLEPKLDELILGRDNSKIDGRIDWDTNNQKVVWRGLPVAVPALSSVRDAGQEYLALTCFPPIWTSNLPPPELYQQIYGRDDLVSFDFEVTENRIPHWRQFYQILEIGTHRSLTSTNAPSLRFLTEVAPHLGEAVTELRSTSPTQMTLVRKSHTGLTAMELVALTRWIESTNFPAFGVFPPAPPKRLPPKR
jgi:hypothetical protein